MTGLLVGRDREVEAIGVALARAVAGHTLAITGEPGIGKSRLLEELTWLAKRRNGTVCSGRADRAVPYGAFFDALDDHLSSWTSPWTPATAPVRFAETVRGLPRPVCLLLDDLQWIDPDSLRLLERLLQAPVPGVLIALGYRNRQAPASLDRDVRRAVTAGLATRLEPRPLSVSEVAMLAGGADPARLHRLSGGNPCYVTALLRSPDPEAGLPVEVQAALELEFGGLIGVDRRVLQASAVAGDEFDAELVAAVAGLGVPETGAALARLAARDVLRGSPDRYRFRHSLLRNAAYATAGPAWRLAAHGRAAEVLAERGASAMVRARHLERAAAPGDESAVEVLTAAAEESAAVSPERSARWLAVALSLLPDRPEWIVRRTDLKLWRARMLGNAGRLRESRDLLHEVLHGLPPGIGEQRAAAVVRCAMAERLLGRHSEARALVRAELSVVKTGRARVELHLELAASRAMTGEPGWSAEVLPAARALGDELVLAGALSLRCLSLLHAGTFDPAILSDAASLIDPLPDGRLGSGLAALTWLGWAEAHADRLTGADRHLTRALRLARSTRQLHLLPQILCGLGIVRSAQGRLSNADSCLSLAARLAHTSASPEFELIATTYHTENLSLRKKADPTPDPNTLITHPHPHLRLLAGTLLARTRWHAGDAEGCAHALRAIGGGPTLPTLDPLTRIPHLALLTEADPEAVVAADAAESTAARLGLRSSLGYAHLARAFVQATPSPALAAADSFARAGYRVQEARARLVAVNLGSGEAALAELDRAEALLAGSDARVYLEQLHRERRRIGRAGDTLTDREREIVRLVVEGRSNREIAGELFISGRTVEGHLTRIYTKLGVSSRGAMAALFADG